MATVCRMYGLFQTSFYFGYMAVFSLSLGILCGTIGYMGTRYVIIIIILSENNWIVLNTNY